MKKLKKAMVSSGYWIHDARCRMQDAGYRMLVSG